MTPCARGDGSRIGPRRGPLTPSAPRQRGWFQGNGQPGGQADVGPMQGWFAGQPQRRPGALINPAPAGMIPARDRQHHLRRGRPCARGDGSGRRPNRRCTAVGRSPQPSSRPPWRSDPDKIATNEQIWSRHRPETITLVAGRSKKPQVKDHLSGRAPGTRTQNLWIKSPQFRRNSLLDALPRPISQYHYVPFGPRSPFAFRGIGPTAYRVLPGGTATYEHPPSTQTGRWAWITMHRAYS